MSILFFPILSSLFSIVFACFLVKKINQAPSNSGKEAEISQTIRDGAISYIKREYKILGLAVIFFSFILGIFLKSLTIVSGFLLGAFFSAAAGYIGMTVSTKANVKVIKAAEKGLKESLDLSFKGGSATGFLVAGLGLFLVSVFYYLTKNIEALIALSFGASLISIFARLGGGIYTKAADIGADLVGKIEKGIPEDDPRNPAVIADQVGDNVGDCVGMAADLFETYVATLVAAMALGSFLLPKLTEEIFLPLLLASAALVSSIISVFFVRLGKSQRIMAALSRGLFVAGILSATGFFLIISKLFQNFKIPLFNLYFPALLGLLLTVFIFFVT